MSNENYNVHLRQQIRNFLIRDFGWRHMEMGTYFDVFGNYYRAVVAIVQYHKEQKCSVYVARDCEIAKVVDSQQFKNIHDFQKHIIDYL